MARTKKFAANYKPYDPENLPPLVRDGDAVTTDDGGPVHTLRFAPGYGPHSVLDSKEFLIAKQKANRLAKEARLAAWYHPEPTKDPTPDTAKPAENATKPTEAKELPNPTQQLKKRSRGDDIETASQRPNKRPKNEEVKTAAKMAAKTTTLRPNLLEREMELLTDFNERPDVGSSVEDLVNGDTGPGRANQRRTRSKSNTISTSTAVHDQENFNPASDMGNQRHTLSQSNATSTSTGVRTVEEAAAFLLAMAADSHSDCPSEKVKVPAQKTMDPVPKVIEPAPQPTESASKTTDPASEAIEAATGPTKPVLKSTDPAPEPAELAPKTTNPMPEAIEPAPEPIKPALESTNSAPEAIGPAQEPTKPVPNPTTTAPESIKPAPEPTIVLKPTKRSLTAEFKAVAQKPTKHTASEEVETPASKTAKLLIDDEASTPFQRPPKPGRDWKRKRRERALLKHLQNGGRPDNFYGVGYNAYGEREPVVESGKKPDIVANVEDSAVVDPAPGVESGNATTSEANVLSASTGLSSMDASSLGSETSTLGSAPSSFGSAPSSFGSENSRPINGSATDTGPKSAENLRLRSREAKHSRDEEAEISAERAPKRAKLLDREMCDLASLKHIQNGQQPDDVTGVENPALIGPEQGVEGESATGSEDSVFKASTMLSSVETKTPTERAPKRAKGKALKLRSLAHFNQWRNKQQPNALTSVEDSKDVDSAPSVENESATSSKGSVFGANNGLSSVETSSLGSEASTLGSATSSLGFAASSLGSESSRPIQESSVDPCDKPTSEKAETSAQKSAKHSRNERLGAPIQTAKRPRDEEAATPAERPTKRARGEKSQTSAQKAGKRFRDEEVATPAERPTKRARGGKSKTSSQKASKRPNLLEMELKLR
ncbi:hypothetical protein EJ06DRAFT_582720 [Trichodelitschia bisporula]|uniref:Uncharacterized protein n=1 Tax=Trichodelitschia bisporula TaxID=703511 RepID=A0A6G1HTP2_9PEZI|nr:hypothetical protein EJ06DRAFT_582720 [Trichodelitschia bisporula]